MKAAYSPRKHEDYPSVESSEENYPTVHLDVLPAQLEGIKAGEEVTVTITGVVKGMNMDTEDSWGTGAGLRISLRTSEIEKKDNQDLIGMMLDED